MERCACNCFQCKVKANIPLHCDDCWNNQWNTAVAQMRIAAKHFESGTELLQWAARALDRIEKERDLKYTHEVRVGRETEPTMERRNADDGLS
jgi:hypothetical protein